MCGIFCVEASQETTGQKNLVEQVSTGFAFDGERWDLEKGTQAACTSRGFTKTHFSRLTMELINICFFSVVDGAEREQKT